MHHLIFNYSCAYIFIVIQDCIIFPNLFLDGIVFLQARSIYTGNCHISVDRFMTRIAQVLSLYQITFTMGKQKCLILGFLWIWSKSAFNWIPKGFRAILPSMPYTALLAENCPRRSLSNINSNFMDTHEK